MKRFKEIILSTVEPTDTNVLWLNPDLDELLYYSNNGWSPIYLDSSIIEPKSVSIERVDVHIGREFHEWKDRSYILYKVNINPSSINIPYLVSWSTDILGGYDILSVDSLNNHYCKVFIDKLLPEDSGTLTATVTYGNKVIKGITTVLYCSFLTINVDSNLKGIDDGIFAQLGGSAGIGGQGISLVINDSEIPVAFGETIPVLPNSLYLLVIRLRLSKMYDFIGGVFNLSNYTYTYSINTSNIGSYLTKTILVKARAVGIKYKYKDKILPSSTMVYSDLTYSTVLIKWYGSGIFIKDDIHLAVRPYSLKDAVLVSNPMNSTDGTGETDKVVIFDDIVTNDFEDDYTEVTLEGYTVEDKEDIAVVIESNHVNSNLKVVDILRNNRVPSSHCFFYTKEDVAKITDIGVWFRESNIETFDEFLYFTGITELSRSAFSDCKSLTSIIIPKNITEISERCFYSCTRLLNISIPSSVNKIGPRAFMLCSHLSSIDLSNVESIGGWAFSSSGLTSLILPNSISTVPDYLCYNCSKLTSVLLPTHITSIGEYSFASCGLLNINIPDSIVTIGDFAFMKNLLLTSLNIGKDCNLLSIGKQAFKETKISELLIPKNVNLIESYAFYNIETLLSITFYGTQTESKVTIEPCAFAIDTNRTSVLDTIEFMSTYIRLPNIISINSTIFDNVASNGTIYVRSYSNGWESDLGIKYLLEDKGWTISYTISATGVIIDNPTSDDNKYEVDLGDSI